MIVMENPIRRLLLIDDRYIHNVKNAVLGIGDLKKHEANPLFTEELPWEARFDNLYANVLFDGKDQLYKCWYSPFLTDDASQRTPIPERRGMRYYSSGRRMGLCYAVSHDGLHWEKPPLGRIHFAGSDKNNIVLADVHGTGIFYDEKSADRNSRYKAIFSHDPDHGMGVSFSPDGIQWLKKPIPIDWPTHSEIDGRLIFKGDTHNHVYRDPSSGLYILITRGFDGRERLVAQSQSDDFIHWSPPQILLRGEGIRDQIYAMPTWPYEGAYIGFPCIFNKEKDVVTSELAYSANGMDWKRICKGEQWIPLGEGLANYPNGDYDCGCIFPAVHPIQRGEQIHVYYGGSNGCHTQMREGSFCLATVQKDGFAGYRPRDPKAEALVYTNDFLHRDGVLGITANIDGGQVRAEIRNEHGESLQEFSCADCTELTSPVCNRVLRWRGKTSVSLAGRRISLLISIRGKAMVYSVSLEVDQ
jgi:hypothetical protein